MKQCNTGVIAKITSQYEIHLSDDDIETIWSESVQSLWNGEVDINEEFDVIDLFSCCDPELIPKEYEALKVTLIKI